MTTVPSASNTVTLPVIEERLTIGRETLATGTVRVRIEPRETVQPVQLEGWSESVEVERISVDQPVAERRAPWHEAEGEVLVVPVYEERVVVRRELVLKEELHLRKRRTPHLEQREVVLRTEHAQVQRLGGDGTRQDDDVARGPGPRPLTD